MKTLTAEPKTVNLWNTWRNGWSTKRPRKDFELNNERYRVQQQNEAEMASVLQEKIQKEAELLVQKSPEYADPNLLLKNDLRNYGQVLPSRR